MKKISDNYLTEAQKIEVEIASEKILKLINENKGEIDEGLLGSIIGGLGGLTFGPAIGKAICKALGIERGLLYNLLTSRAFTTAVASYIGYKQ